MRDLNRGALVNGYRLLLALLSLLVAACTTMQPPTEPPLGNIDPSDRMEAEKRITAWRALIQNAQNESEAQKLVLVNDFINSLAFMSDLEHWHQLDYWATPLETVGSGGGDCEDLAIAKYFTLKYLHVSENRLRIVYAKSRELHKSHMVLAYYPVSGAEPLLLDNLVPEIEPVSQRNDLLLIYSFNATGLWLARRPAPMNYMGSSSRIAPWHQLLKKMQATTYIAEKQTVM